MSIVNRPTRVMIGDGTAVPTTFATIATGDIAVVKRDMTTLAAGETIANSDVIFIAQGTSPGPVLSSPIKGASVRTFTGAAFTPDSRNTVHIGYDRITSQSINVLNDTEYSFNIVLKDEKELWSHRQLRKVYFFTSDANATVTEIAQGLAAELQIDINESGELLPLQVVVIGDGTGGTSTATVGTTTVTTHDMTAPTNVGIEITGTDYTFSLLKGFQKVFFEVGLNAGFDSTTVVAETQAMNLGNGGFEQVSVSEDFGLFYFGFSNRRLHPLSTPTRYVTSTPETVSIVETVTTVQDDDEITFSAAPAIAAGSRINVTGVAETLEIKFFVSTTVAVITTAATAAVSTAATTRDEFYDVYTIEHDDDSASGAINGATVSATVRTEIYIPSNTVQGTSLQGLLNPWMASTPRAFANVVL